MHVVREDIWDALNSGDPLLISDACGELAPTPGLVDVFAAPLIFNVRALSWPQTPDSGPKLDALRAVHRLVEGLQTDPRYEALELLFHRLGPPTRETIDLLLARYQPHRDTFERAVGRHPRFVAGYGSVAGRLLQMKDHERAVPFARFTVDSPHGTATHRINYASIVYSAARAGGDHRNELPRVLAYLLEGAAERPHMAHRLHNQRGLIHQLLLGDFDSAIECFEAAVEARDDYGIALNNLAWLYFQTGQNLEQAYDYAERSVALRPEGAPPARLSTLGHLELDVHDNLERAEALAHEGILGDPEIEGGRFLLARVLMRKGDLTAAQDVLEALIERAPENTRYRSLLSEVRDAQGVGRAGEPGNA